MRAILAAAFACFCSVTGVQAQSQGTPQSTLKATHGSWEIRCYGANDCVMSQIHSRTAETADAVFTVIKPVGLNDTNGVPIQALAEIVVPLGVFLPNGLGLQIDGGAPRAVPYERCIPDGCVVRAPISDEVLQQMRAGSTAYLILSRSPTETVRLPIALNGFTSGFNSL